MLLPSKEQREENRRNVRERHHWSRLVQIMGLLWLLHVLLQNMSSASSYIYLPLIGFLITIAPLVSAYRARNSHSTKRRFVAKELYEICLAASVIYIVIYLFSLFNSMSYNFERGVVAGISSVGIIGQGLYYRHLYQRLIKIQQVDPEDDRMSKKEKRNTWITFFVLFILISSWYFIWIV
ncbi:hypothetical protein [Alkalicoccobacillus plakortidis]|uniref:Uncharacterized protein n=1 Tax=Alkalicoccobacillus plakortidis TaxID=444060 RepID=A0ABT0XLV6_9BACI|nr:hypothetical protein [Alkalicoccobacillus plakortidis]MCM2676884.1 hypothetical protein [Alkalicoccobacillus plakortidis]